MVMSSPVSVTVANIVMVEIEEHALTTFSLLPRFWKCYVDDTCTILPRLLVTEFHDHLNSVNSSIWFTFEEEQDLSLPFLDVLMQRQTDGKILTLVFGKATHNNNYLKFLSHHPLHHKVSVIQTLYDRVRGLSSTSVQRVSEEAQVFKALEQNSYLAQFVGRISLKPTLRSSFIEPSSGHGGQDLIAKVTLPYIHGISETLGRILHKLNVEVHYHPHRTLRQILVRSKDVTPIESYNGVV